MNGGFYPGDLPPSRDPLPLWAMLAMTASASASITLLIVSWVISL
jgi:hypothetical protein